MQTPDPKEEADKHMAKKPSYHSQSHGNIETMNRVSVYFILLLFIFFTKLLRQNLEFNFKYAFFIYVFNLFFNTNKS